MALPAAIQQQVAEAEAIQQEVYASQEPAPAAPPVDEPPAQVVEPTNVVELKPNVEPAPTVEAPKPDATDELAYWKKRFDTVQGVLNAEVPKLHSQLKEQNQQIQNLLAQLQEKKAEPPAAQDSLVTAKDVEDYGADLIDMTRRVAAEEVRKAIAQAMGDFKKEVGTVQQQVGQVQEQVIQDANTKFWNEVMRLVPDWQEVDADPRWVEWLNTTPDFAEDTYRDLAAKAIYKGDAQKVAKLVERWRGPQQAPAVKPPVNPELQRQVAPSTTKSSAPAPQGEKVWTREEYEQAMDVRNINRYGKAKADAMEAEANRAVAEGRVRW